MDARGIIAAKRDGGTLDAAQIGWFARGLADGTVSDAQAGAFAMAVLQRGMNGAERIALTQAMRDSGQVQRWDLPGPVIDKHSTGGVGDNVSLILAPALAACGAYVPMISGRGLGHTGGTLDKLDAIPGYRTSVGGETLHRVVAETGCAIVGASGEIAPADRRLYAIRDESGTVESLDLITASILSKKLAAGLEALVLDVKTGSGAFMKSEADSTRLAEALVAVANGAGCRTTALVTDMNEPLARAAGNALEVASAMDVLTMAEVDARLWDVTVALGGAVLATAGIAKDSKGGEAMLAESLQSGRAAAVMGKMVRALGGPTDFAERYRERLPEAAVIADIEATEAGFVTAIDTMAVGLAVVDLGGGRKRADDALDLSVGFDELAGLGVHLAKGDPIARVHARDEASAAQAARVLRDAFQIGASPVAETPLIVARVG